MTEFNETLVRRYFEIKGYLVRANVRYRFSNGYSDIDIIGLNPITADAVAVEVKGWHTEGFTLGTFKGFPSLLNFTSDAATTTIKTVLGEHDFRRVLVVGRLGVHSEAQVRAHLAAHHLDLLLFADVLATLMSDLNTNKNADSDAEHLLRLLRIYGHLPHAGT